MTDHYTAISPDRKNPAKVEPMSRRWKCLKEPAEEFVARPWLFIRLNLVSLFHENRKYRMKPMVSLAGEILDFVKVPYPAKTINSILTVLKGK